MKNIARLAPLSFLICALLFCAQVFAGDRTIDLSSGCKIYKLAGKKWGPTDSAAMNGLLVPQSDILRDEDFTVFKTVAGTYGTNRRCVIDSAAAPEVPPARRAATPIPVRGDLKTPWSAVFSFGYNLSPSGEITSDYLGATTTDAAKFKSSLTFLGEGNYRMASAFRLALELGISQLATSAQSGNETSFFDLRPEFIFRAGRKIELFLGPMVGLFFLSQNTETQTLTGSNSGTTIAIKQQTASAVLLGVSFGADYTLSSQFDLGIFVRYFKPGTLTLTGTESFPVPGNTYEAKLTTSYLSSGLRFAIHF